MQRARLRSCYQVGHDKFCYYCGRKCQKFSCSECFRSFHAKCLEEKGVSPMNHDDDAFICPFCIELERAKLDFVGKESLLRLLKYPMNKILNDPNFKNLERLQGEDIANPIGLSDIQHKVDNMVYDSLEEFLLDIECIYHSYGIRAPSKAVTAYKLVQFCESEINHILSCAECYEMKYTKPNEWQTFVCSTSHLLLWVKLDKHSTEYSSLSTLGNVHWPAKLLNPGNKIEKVICFGHSELVELPTNNCFMYSTLPPTDVQIQSSESLEYALKECDLYKQNIQRKFGRVEVKWKSIPFEPIQYGNHMQAMFPEYNSNSPRDQNGSNDSATLHTDEFSFDDFVGIPEKRRRLGGSREMENDDNTTLNARQGTNSMRRVSLSSYLGPGPSDSTTIPTSSPSTSPANVFEPNSLYQTSEGHSTFEDELQGNLKFMENFVKKRENFHQTKIQELQQELERAKQTNVELESKMQQTLAEHETLKLQYKGLVDNVGKLQQDKCGLDQELQTNRNKVIELEKSRDGALAELQTLKRSYADAQAKNGELLSQFDHVSSELGKVKVIHDKALNELKTGYDTKITELEGKLKNATDENDKGGEQLKQKFNQIIKNVRDEAQNRLNKALKCKSCGESKAELFCSSLCEYFRAQPKIEPQESLSNDHEVKTE